MYTLSRRPFRAFTGTASGSFLELCIPSLSHLTYYWSLYLALFTLLIPVDPSHHFSTSFSEQLSFFAYSALPRSLTHLKMELPPFCLKILHNSNINDSLQLDGKQAVWAAPCQHGSTEGIEYYRRKYLRSWERRVFFRLRLLLDL